MSTPDVAFRRFQSDISRISKPEKFTFPFYYEPHSLSILASEELQRELESHVLLAPLFDAANPECLPAGKMFGVLIVKNQAGELGYLRGFSGKLGPYTHLEGFVPPVFDLWNKDSFFTKEEAVLNAINAQIEKLQKDSIYQQTKELLQHQIASEKKAIADKKQSLKQLKNERKLLREQQESQLTPLEFEVFNDDLIKQSLRDKHELRVLTTYWQEQIEATQQLIRDFDTHINSLKEERKQKSNALQRQLFQQYRFLNYNQEEQDLLDIFEKTALQQPPAAAGDCAAPKLLQYAYLNGYKPLAMAEFWWGESPKSEIRKHQHYYPACRGKCEPILGHMLQGLNVDDNPLLINPELQRPIEIVYEDEDFAIVNKPEEFLSVPGIYIQDSVYERMKIRYPKATGPIIVHRLDMATSGILIIAKNKEAHKALQSQFIKKTVTKRYVALLDGIVTGNEGYIDLPLRVDLEDRPRQMVCFEHGKPAKTKWEVIERKNGKTKVYFYPITGRTHQLRMHASHPMGLNTPIIGDDLYGSKNTRLFLHAESITFKHPRTQETVNFQVKEGF
ncbi:RluA family pseudouridine synthase [Myroides odoratus]|uniref:RNA pseudouridine synthase n=1 Tax=Myroides odoratus TaxID=256 RepID=A0A9Q6ZDS0_MYROD|nr:pseudouridine synthase [Myroides odoratus]EHQ43482.1 pseudouridine synthase [Myroides odoratus DSM 2801]EKB06149.1 RluA family pseudouridine synthase [Myroides odoratus CIP 103059]QQU00816.1 RNA pseudouridine synthase [Myroides odoratus]WQD56942.1 pseudouridine synthase [Myroides odoratus]STZ30761.1 Ribosomal large subunit pseudouridine synthase A [Myroides odoratus]